MHDGKQKRWLLALLFVLALCLVSCQKEQAGEKEKTSAADVQSEERKEANQMTYDELKKAADGATVHFYGWGGSQLTNDWIEKTLAPMVKKEYNITLKRVGMNIDEILNLMLQEKKADKKDGSVDLVWINGENFYTASQNSLLYGPFTYNLPNFKKYIDENSPDVKQDFGKDTEGMEMPFGKAQFVMVYDSEKISQAPTNLDALKAWIKEHPGKFTYAALPDFTASAFVRNVISNLVGYEPFMTMKPDKETVKKAIQPAIDYLNEIKPYLWKEGKSYPSDTTQLDNMFADGEVWMTISYNPNSASANIEQGKFPKTTKTFVFDKGTIGNTHFVAIADNSTQKAAAMLVANAIVSVPAQVSKYDPKVWGDLPVLDNAKLSDEEKKEFDNVPIGMATLPQDELMKKRIPEMPANIVPVIEQIWTEEVLNAQ